MLLIGHFLLDTNIDNRQKFLAETIGPLDMEIEAWNLSFYFAWIFYPIFIVMTGLQFLFFNLYNSKHHPLSMILDGAHSKGSLVRKE